MKALKIERGKFSRGGIIALNAAGANEVKVLIEFSRRYIYIYTNSEGNENNLRVYAVLKNQFIYLCAANVSILITFGISLGFAARAS